MHIEIKYITVESIIKKDKDEILVLKNLAIFLSNQFESWYIFCKD